MSDDAQGFQRVTLQKGAIMHNPPKTYGDCHRAAVAMVLDVPITDVPHFFDKPETPYSVFEEWITANGMGTINFQFPGEVALADLMNTVEFQNPGRPFILGCQSGLGVAHSVVVQSGEIFDPSPVNSGAVGPMHGENWHVTFIVSTPKGELVAKGNGDE